MSAESKSLLERWLEAGDAGDVEAFHEFLHDDVVVHAPLGLSSRGIEAEKDVWRAAVAAIADLRHDVQEVIVDGDSMAARAIVTGTLVEAFAGVPPSGAPFRIDQVVFAHVRDGKASEVWEVADVGVLLRGGG
ncbi:MAG TPA: ester cyclase [Gaiella sp.]|nr:ester cyclase [Gaiella sp.]